MFENSINETVSNVIREYEGQNGELHYYNDKENDNADSLYEPLENYDVNKKAYKKAKQ